MKTRARRGRMRADGGFGTHPATLHCTKPDGSELRVEVKGTAGDGTTILLTANEVEHARRFHPRVALFVVTPLSVVKIDSAVQVTGDEEPVLDAWTIDDAMLRPLSFSYRFKSFETGASPAG